MGINNYTLVSNCLEAQNLASSIGFKPSNFILISHQFPIIKKERPLVYTDRIAKDEIQKYEGINVLVTMKTVFVGRRLILIPSNEKEIRKTLYFYSGRNQVIYNSFFLKSASGVLSHKRIMTRFKIKHLTTQEIEDYISSRKWENNIAGHSFESVFQSFIIKTTGSYTGAMGFSCYEARNLLQTLSNTTSTPL